METDDPFASLGGLGSGLGANFGPRTAPFRSQSFNVGSGHGSGPGGKKDKVQDPAVEHDLYVSLDDINKVRTEVLGDGKVVRFIPCMYPLYDWVKTNGVLKSHIS